MIRRQKENRRKKVFTMIRRQKEQQIVTAENPQR